MDDVYGVRPKIVDASNQFFFPMAVSVVGPPQLLVPFRIFLTAYNSDFAYPRVVHAPYLDRYFWFVNGASPWSSVRPEYFGRDDILAAECYYQWTRIVDPQRWPKIVADHRRRRGETV